MPRLDDSSLDTTQRVGSCNVTRGSGPASYNYRNVTQTTSDQPMDIHFRCRRRDLY